VAELGERWRGWQRDEARRRETIGQDRDAEPGQRRGIEPAEAAAGAYDAPVSSGPFLAILFAV
jgi:hypothetical protein